MGLRAPSPTAFCTPGRGSQYWIPAISKPVELPFLRVKNMCTINLIDIVTELCFPPVLTRTTAKSAHGFDRITLHPRLFASLPCVAHACIRPSIESLRILACVATIQKNFPPTLTNYTVDGQAEYMDKKWYVNYSQRPC